MLLAIGVFQTALISSCEAAEEGNKLDEYRNIIREEYPNFEAQPLVYSTDDYDTAGFVFDDILVGDFNGDSLEEFAATLKRTRSKAEAYDDERQETRDILVVGAAVVCESSLFVGGSQTSTQFRCRYLVEPTLGGLKGELAFVEVNAEHLPKSRLSSGENCEECTRKSAGKRALALINSYGGYCLNLYYPVAGSATFKECIYCSD
jgi:hypothetical protein